jgi:DNA helicase-2/ATP-dependent DNA helicase PcrA
MVNKPARGVGPSALAKITETSEAQALDYLTAARAAKPKLSAKAGKAAENFVDLLDSVRLCLEKDEMPLYEAIQRLATESGLSSLHQAEDEIAGSQRVANIEELANFASQYPPGMTGLISFLDAISLDRSRDSGEEVDAVTLITMHNTKGLEFPLVIVTGLEQGLFPRANGTEEDLEEERRLFYVAITRAMDSLYFTYCSERRVHGLTQAQAPSLFLYELPPDITGKLAGSAEQAASGCEWATGQTVYHDEYGPGVVSRAKKSPDGLELVQVCFSSGLNLKFIPAYDKKLIKTAE